MKMKIGNRLLTAREDRQLSQTEMADLLGVSTSTYARIERNESSIELDQITNFSKILNIPIQEFLPDTITINNDNQNGHIGLVMGNIYNYSYSDQELKFQLESQATEIKFLKTEIENLKEIIKLLKEKP